MALSVILRRRKLGRTSCREIAAKAASDIKVVRNWKARDVLAVRDPHVVFRWGCTSSLSAGGIMQNANDITVNTAEAIHWCSDKKNGRLAMQEAGVPVPKTWSIQGFNLLWYMNQAIEGKYVLRRAQHAQGRDLWFGTAEEVLHAARDNHVQDGYVSQLIDKVAEYRVFVCQNRAVWVAKKTPGNPEAVAWNVAQGGRFDNVRWDEWNTKVVDAALKAAKVSGTDFCGVDVMVDAEGLPYVLEVNSAPSQTSPYRQQCVAKAFDYIIQNNSKAHFEDVEWHERRTWKSYIHPAVRGSDDE